MSAGPNLLAWAKENQSVGFYEASDILGQLARAILADEEERKRRDGTEVDRVSAVTSDQRFGEPPSE